MTTERPVPPVLVGLAELGRTRGTYVRATRALRWLTPIGAVTFAALAARAIPPQAALRPLELAALGGFALGAGGAMITRGRPRRLHVSLWLLLLVASSVLLVTGPARVGALGLVIALAVTPRRPDARSAFAFITVVALITVALTAERHGSVLDATCTATTVGCLAIVACLVRRLGTANELAEQLVRELHAGRARAREAAAVAERQSLARELHDVLAHSLSALVLHLEAARAFAAEAPDDRRLPVTLDRAAHLARTGLDEARQAIGVLRDDRSLPGPDELPALVQQFTLTTGTRCALDVRGAPRTLRHEVRLSVFRVAQEALTNISRHAEATMATVVLDYTADQVHLVVEDNGTSCPPKSDVSHAGYGLSGMAERAELLEGSLTAGPTPTGFRVELAVPA